VTLSVRYHAHHLELSGYGRAAAGNIRALRLAGVEVDVRPVVSPLEATPVDVAIYHTMPVKLSEIVRSPARRHVVYTAWETDPMPEKWCEALRAFDAVIVPSTFCAEIMGLDTFTIPHSFDPGFWRLTDAPKNDVFTFYSIGAWGERKNTLGLLRAYLHAFRKKDRTRLVLIVDKANFLAIQSLIARSLIPQDELPGLVIPDQRLTDEEILRLHQDSDCFVTATRGEGFGLPIFEAAIMGKPIIAPDWGAQVEFLEGSLQWHRVWHFKTPVFASEDEAVVDGGRLQLKISLPHGANAGQVWAEPSLERLAFLMRFVKDEWSGDDHDRRDFYEERYSDAVIGQRFVHTLQEILK
jgi:glycosyltransferase involved in cell wall biosynthesis